jgi:demethylmenaquinone methyltransferase/2-methoxy-6-polyprenyl-1,4-benzoquinol methylase
MGWYDVLSGFYDAALEAEYREQRRIAAERLDLRPDSVVLDLPCGTGQSLPFLAPKAARVLAADLSEGMLAQASRRAEREGFGNVRTVRADATAVTLDELGARPDRLHVFLGLSVFPDFERTFARLWDLLAPGGRAVVVDVHAASPGVQGRMVMLVARADIRRRYWEPMERLGEGFERVALPTSWRHGGEIGLATARKPA